MLCCNGEIKHSNLYAAILGRYCSPLLPPPPNTHTHTHTQSIVQKREELRALIKPHQSEDGEGEEEEVVQEEEERVKSSPSLHSNTAVITFPHTKPPSSHKAPLTRHKSAPAHSQHTNSFSELPQRKVSL